MGEVTVQAWDMGTDKPLFLVMRKLGFSDMGAGAEINSVFVLIEDIVIYCFISPESLSCFQLKLSWKF